MYAAVKIHSFISNTSGSAKLS